MRILIVANIFKRNFVRNINEIIYTYSFIISAGRSSGTSSKPTSRHDNASSSTAPEHWQPRNSQTAQMCRADAPYEPYCFSALSYNSLASCSESIDDGITTDSRMTDSNGGETVGAGDGDGGGAGCCGTGNGTDVETQ